MRSSHFAWDTDDEIDWLNRIGETMKTRQRKTMSKADLLRGYIAIADNRYDWGGIDKSAAVAHAEHLLRKQR